MSAIMPWIGALAGVAATDFPARRDHIAAMVRQARTPGADSAALLADAYVAACLLEGDAKARWSIGEVDQAQREHRS